MQKFAVIEKDEKGRVIGFFQGGSFSSNQEDTVFYDDRDKATYYLGRASQSFPEKNIEVRTVKLTATFDIPIASPPVEPVEVNA